MPRQYTERLPSMEIMRPNSMKANNIEGNVLRIVSSQWCNDTSNNKHTHTFDVDICYALSITPLTRHIHTYIFCYSLLARPILRFTRKTHYCPLQYYTYI